MVGHKTFSLLHYHLVPYWKYSIPFIIKVLKAKYNNNLSLKLLQDYIADFSAAAAQDEDDDSYIELCISRIYSFRKLILETIHKLWISKYYYELKIGKYHSMNNINNMNNMNTNINSESGEKGLINTFLQVSKEFECLKLSLSKPIRGPCALSMDFYLEGGSYVLNSPFLFGTPSQFRF